MKQKIFLLYASVALLIIAILLQMYYPVKKSINEIELKDIDKEYIVCTAEYTTGFNWYVIESSTGYTGYVFVEGILSDYNKFEREVTTSENKFVLYGNFDGNKVFDGEEYPIFLSKDWDIVYPVRRNLPFEFLYPKYGLNKLDLT